MIKTKCRILFNLIPNICTESHTTSLMVTIRVLGKRNVIKMIMIGTQNYIDGRRHIQFTTYLPWLMCGFSRTFPNAVTIISLWLTNRFLELLSFVWPLYELWVSTLIQLKNVAWERCRLPGYLLGSILNMCSSITTSCSINSNFTEWVIYHDKTNEIIKTAIMESNKLPFKKMAKRIRCLHHKPKKAVLN